ncbi:hypothetical protein Btru_076787 [Bulinus truncatus]|nr:hypothetical protein Btru_076787 [Bulinus truncatus]
MGLSKKLGVLSQKTIQPGSQEVAYKWSQQTYTLHDVIRKFKMPCIVQCAADPCSVLWSDFQFDLHQPLLLYSTRCIQKVHAISLQEDQSKKIYEELQPSLAIPKDFEGWFGGRSKGVDTFKRIKRIEDIAISTASRFLVTSKCSAFTPVKSAGGRQYKEKEITPGEVIRKVCVMNGEPVDDALTSIIKNYGPCLVCLDEKDDETIIPLASEAICYEVAETYPETGAEVFRISSLVDVGNSKLPRVLQLVYGDPPVLNYSFTGILRCYSIFTEETILAAVLDPNKSMCLELTTDSVAKFRLALNESVIKRTVEYTNAHQLCDTFGPKFWTGIKVSFMLRPVQKENEKVQSTPGENSASNTYDGVKRDVNGSDTLQIYDNDIQSDYVCDTQDADDSDAQYVDDSDIQDINDSDTQYTNDSDTQDINADSEFDIKWRTDSGGKSKRFCDSDVKISHPHKALNKLSNELIRKVSIESIQKLNKESSRKLSDDSIHEFSDDSVHTLENVQTHRHLFENKNILNQRVYLKPDNCEYNPEAIENVSSIKIESPNYLGHFNQLENTSLKVKKIISTSAEVESAEHCGQTNYDKENPLQYLFQPVEHPPISERCDSEVNVNKAISDDLSDCPSVYQRITCKPAREYIDSEEEGSVNSSEGGTSSENGNSSDCEDNGNGSKFDKVANCLDACECEESSIYNENSDCDSNKQPVKYNKQDGSVKTLALDLNEANLALNEANLAHFENQVPEDSNSDFDADDIFSLAASETEKLSTLSYYNVHTTQRASEKSEPASDCQGNSITSDRLALLRQSFSSDLNTSQESFARFSNLIEEVTALVNTSSCRILNASHRLQKNRNRLLIQKTRNDKGYTELVSSTETLPDTSTAPTPKPPVYATDSRVAKPSSLPLLNQETSNTRQKSKNITSSSLDDLATMSNTVKTSDELSLLPKQTSRENSQRGFGVLRRTCGQLSLIDTVSSKSVKEQSRTQNTSYISEDDQIVTKTLDNHYENQQSYCEAIDKAENSSLHSRTEIDQEEFQIYSNIAFVKQNVENVELSNSPATLSEMESEWSSISDLNSFSCPPDIINFQMSDNPMSKNQTVVEHFWI